MMIFSFADSGLTVQAAVSIHLKQLAKKAWRIDRHSPNLLKFFTAKVFTIQYAMSKQ